MTGLRKTQIHKSVNRPNLFMGGDREAVMVTAMLSAILIVVVMEWIAFFIGVALWFGAVFFLRKAAEADPQMRDVYLRHIQYKKFYPARSTPFRVSKNKREY